MSADTAAGGIALASALGGFSEPSLIGTIKATTGGFEDALFLLGGFTAAAAVLGLLATRHESRRVQSDAKAKEVRTPIPRQSARPKKFSVMLPACRQHLIWSLDLEPCRLRA
jgi:hypothetical protein